MTWSINSPFGGLSSSDSQVGYALLTHSQVAIIQIRKSVHAAPLLACVKPVASVHPEPGSNSPLYNISCTFTSTFTPSGRRKRSVTSLISLKMPNNIREINDFLIDGSYLVTRRPLTLKSEASALLYYSRCFMYLYQRTLSYLSLSDP